MQRVVGFIAVTVLGMVMTTTYLAGTAFAHAAYESSDPGNGETVSSPPSRVVADFTEALNGDASSLTVIDPCGEQVDNGDSLVANDRITISMSADKQGTYVVRFDVLSAVDGHPTRGQFIFTSSGGNECPGEGGGEGGSEGGDGSGGSTGGGSDSGGGTNEEPAPGSGGSGAGSSDTTTSNATGGKTGSKTRIDGVGSRRERTRADRNDDDDDTVAAPGDTATETGAVEDSGIWDGIPMGDFFVALGVAALIGAAGGRIYAGIVGPRR